MESYLNQLYENIIDKRNEYNEMLDQHFMDIFNIKRDQLKYLKECFEYDDFIIVNDVTVSTENITKLDKEYIKFNITNLNLKSRCENLFSDFDTYDSFIKFDSIISNINHWFKSEEMNKYFIHFDDVTPIDDYPLHRSWSAYRAHYKFVLVLDEQLLNKVISILEHSFNILIDINHIQKIEMID